MRAGIAEIATGLFRGNIMQNIIYQKNTKYFLMVAVYCLIIAAATLSSASVTRTITYTYDNLDRLTSVSYGGEASISYDYDDAGNILRAVIQGGVQDIELSDAIIAMQILTEISPSLMESNVWDINADGKIGIEEAVYILQVISKLRQ